MPSFPLNLNEYFGHWDVYIVYLAIGFAFGVVLEIAGFGNSRKLAAQFYFKDMTVLKVMFTAIVVAMSLIFLTSALGWLDYDKLWVNPTYLWPGIVGGLIMGVGFIIGGFCPGTSLVSAATGKLDGLFFVLGALVGIFLFGESVEQFESFWTGSAYGRYTLMDVFDVDAGVIVLGVVLMALFVFWGAEQLERIIGKQDLSRAPHWRYGAAGGLVVLASATLLIGQPGPKPPVLSEARAAQLESRAVYVHPAELLKALNNRFLTVVLIDVRSKADYDQFHIENARHIPLDDVLDEADTLRKEPANTIFALVDNDETLATEAWRRLGADGMINVFILEGGINHWLEVFPNNPAAPDPKEYAAIEFEKKITLEKPSEDAEASSDGGSTGGCG